MKKIIALVSVLVLCIACVSTAFAAESLTYRADYTIKDGDLGYGPSTIYHKTFNKGYAMYKLEKFEIDGADCPEPISVHMYDRQSKKQVTMRPPVLVDEVIKIDYMPSCMPAPTDTLKPVTYKPSYYLHRNAIIEASFDP